MTTIISENPRYIANPDGTTYHCLECAYTGGRWQIAEGNGNVWVMDAVTDTVAVDAFPATTATREIAAAHCADLNRILDRIQIPADEVWAHEISHNYTNPCLGGGYEHPGTGH